MMFKKISTYALVLFLALSVAVLSAAQIRWLAIGDLHNWFSSAGSEVEVGRTGATSDQLDGMRYPGLYPAQDVQACKGIWLGCKNYADPTDGGKNYANKVINCGPRLVDESNAMMSQTFELVAKRPATTVMVDGAQGKF